MADPEYWGFKDDAMNIFRRDCPGLSDHDLERALEDAAGLPVKQEFNTDGTLKETIEREPPSGGWPVRRRLQFVPGASLPRWAFFLPEVKTLSESIGTLKPAPKPSKSKPAPKPTKRPSTKQKRELITFFQDEARTRGRLLKDAEVLELRKQRGVTVRQARQTAKDAKVVTSKPGRRD
jgi:hypothetical protein